jgi:hypothetical protein
MPRGLAASCVEEPITRRFGVVSLVITSPNICKTIVAVNTYAVEIRIETSMLRQLTGPTFTGVEEPRGLPLIRQFSEK